MEYEKPGILNTFLACDLYGAASGFSSSVPFNPGDDGCFDADCSLY